jgi:hypothetical protein
MLIKLTSNNPNFSYLLAKNPNSGLQGQQLKKGSLFYWFNNTTEFNMYFEDNYDSAMEVSYPKVNEQLNYLDKSSYISSYCVFDIINSCLSHCLKDDLSKFDEFCDPPENQEFWYKLECLIETKGKHNLDIFKRYCDDGFGSVRFDFERFHNYYDVFKIKLESKNFFNMIKVAYIFAAYNSIYNLDKMYLQESFIEKIVNIINYLDAPFFIRYLIKKNMIYSKKIFEKVKKKLEISNRYESIEFANQNDPWEERYNFVYNNLDFNSPKLIDWGFSEGKMLSRLVKLFDEVVGVEIDDDMIERLQWKVENRDKFKNVKVVKFGEDNNFENNFPKFHKLIHGGQVILAEVLEHMQLKEAKQLLHDILLCGPKKVIITTPNKEFNQFFEDGKMEVRYHDHKFEFDTTLLHNVLFDITERMKVNHLNYEFLITPIGDTVNRIPMTLGAVLFPFPR